MIKNHFHTTPKFIRTDNGPEFMLSTFYASLGIIHQKSCVETPQQNGRVERKLQHIINVGRALLYQSKLPPSFWSYVIHHDVFLINIVPTPLFQNQSPYFTLHHKLPDISLFKVFGCLCYASTLHSHRTKLQSRSGKSLFLGYKSGYKGFTIYDLHSREIFVSRHVTFHENHLPYHHSPSSISPDWEYFSHQSSPPTTDTSSFQPPIMDDIVPPPTISSHNPPSSPVAPIVLRHSTRNITSPSYLQDYICNNIHASINKELFPKRESLLRSITVCNRFSFIVNSSSITLF